MTPAFPHLQLEQDGLLELCARYAAERAPSAKAALAEDICRLATLLGQAREEIIDPFLVDHLPAPVQHAAWVEMDLARVLVHELSEARPGELLFDALVAVLGDLLRRRFEAERAEWAHLSPSACAEADIRAGHRLRELDQQSRAAGWSPLPPCGLETLRNSVPPDATRWSDL